MYPIVAATRFYKRRNVFLRSAAAILAALAVSGIYIFHSTSDRVRAARAIAEVARMDQLMHASDIGAQGGNISAWRIESAFGTDTPFFKYGLGLRDPWQGVATVSTGGKSGPLIVDFLDISSGACRLLMTGASAIPGIEGVATTGAAADMREVPVGTDRIDQDCNAARTFFRFVVR
jgi:hypothetical protein